MDSSKRGGVRSVSGEEEEAVRELRAALRNGRGTHAENQERVGAAWQTLRSAATSSDVQVKAQKRHRKAEKDERRRARREKRQKHADANENLTDAVEENVTPLQDAAQLGQADRIAELVLQGAKVSAKNKSGYTALHWASLYGHVEEQHMILECRVTNDDASAKGTIELSDEDASVMGDQVVKALLRAGAGDGKRIDRQNDAGNTALHLACLGRHAEVAYMLQMYKPDEYLLNSYKQSPVSLGLRELIESVRETRRLDDFQAARSGAQRSLLWEALDWRMETDGQRIGADTGHALNDPNDDSIHFEDQWKNWEDYDRAWVEFAQRFAASPGSQNIELASDAAPTDLIHFRDVPWPFQDSNGGVDFVRGAESSGTQRLLLSTVGVAGPQIRPLIQNERLRWHPDKFLQLFGRRVAEEDNKKIQDGVRFVSQLLNSLASEVMS